MRKRRGQGTSQARAIQNTLTRLGMQASPRQVVAALADFGIGVAEALVRRVKVEMLKEAAKVEWQRVKRPHHCERRQIRLPPKKPPSR
jgi:hypothetical protein